MKKLPLIMLSLLTLPAYGQSILGSLNDYQETLSVSQSGSSDSTSSSGTAPQEVTPDDGGTSSNNKQCTSNSQTSLPLTYITSLIMEKNGKLDILHDQRTGQVTWSAPKMISNCASMIDWKLKKPIIEGKQAYAIEAAIKQGENCSDAGCTYNVIKVVDGAPQNTPITVKPDLKGFEQCLKETGVVVDGKVKPEAIFPQQLKEKRTGVDASGKLYFLSSGLMSSQVGGKYGAHEYIDGCDHYESAHPEIKSFLTLADAEKERLDAEAARLRECKVDEYGKLADFIEKYEAYASELGDVRDRLIMEAAKKSAEAIGKGEYTDEDLKVISDFHKYVVQPKVDMAVALYEASLELEGDSKKQVQDQLKQVLAEITALNKKPYFLSSHTLKLIHDGKFEDAEKLNDMKLVLEHHQRLGAKQNNVVITPRVAIERVIAGKTAFADTVVKEKENYEIRTGQVTGKSVVHRSNARVLRENIQVRTRNFYEEMQLEMARVQQPNGYCYKYWRNTQKCIEDSLLRVQELQALLQHYNKVDEERIAEEEGKAKEYEGLEAQGRRYVAAQNGEPVPEEPVETTPEVDTTRPNSRPEVRDPGVYSFNFNQGPQGQPNPQQQAQMTPNMYQYPTNPYGQNNMFMQQQSPYGIYGQQNYMGQQNYGYGNQMGYQMQGGYNFNMGMGMQQNPYAQQQGYWNNPYQAYNMYSAYGQTW